MEDSKLKRKDALNPWERKEILMAVLIGVLVLTAGIQTIQLVGLARAEVVVPASSAAELLKESGGAPSVPTNLQNLPSMVGGC